MKKTILFDIDRTLIYTTDLYIQIRIQIPILLKKYYPKIDTRLAMDVYEKVVRAEIDALRLDMFEVFRITSEILDLDEDLFLLRLKNLFESFDYKSFLYTGIESLLIQIQNSGEFELGVFSEGDKWFQMLKLRNSDLLKFFKEENIFIFKNKLANLDKIMKNSIVIDDSERIVKGIENSERFDLRVIKIDPEKGPVGLDFNSIINEE